MVVSVAAHCAAHCAEVVGVAVGASCSWTTCSMQDRHLARSKTSARSGTLYCSLHDGVVKKVPPGGVMYHVSVPGVEYQ